MRGCHVSVCQMVAVVPLGLLAASLTADFAYLGSGSFRFETLSYWALSAGIVAALLVSVLELFGGFNHAGLWHGLGSGFAACLFIWSWLLRSEGQPATPDAVVLSVLGLSVAAVTCWIGGDLALRHDAGVQERARPRVSP